MLGTTMTERLRSTWCFMKRFQQPAGRSSVRRRPRPSRLRPTLSSHASRSLRTRSYARRAPILLLDEPVGSFDFEGEFAFVDALNRLRGKTTVVLVTYRPSHIRMADKVLVMKDGSARYFGPPAAVIEKITEAFSKEIQKELPA